MQNIRQLSTSKISLFLASVFLGMCFVAVNFFKDYPIIEISKIDDTVIEQLHTEYLFSVESTENGTKQLVFDDIPSQLDAFASIKRKNPELKANLNIKTSAPKFMLNLGIKPLKLGLDLRGGVHFLVHVDEESVLSKILQDKEDEVRKIAASYKASVQIEEHIIHLRYPDYETLNSSFTHLSQSFPQYEVTRNIDQLELLMVVSANYLTEQRLGVMQTTLTSLSKRVNELGVAESSIYQQGLSNIVIDLPGIQDITQAKALIGKTATIKFYLSPRQNPNRDTRFNYKGDIILKKDSQGRKIPIINKPVLTGADLRYAQAVINQDGLPAVDLHISQEKAVQFKEFTASHIGEPLSVLLQETESMDVWNEELGTFESILKKKETVISSATIMSELGERFQISGLSQESSHELALLLRSGSLPADISIVEEKIIGPSLGAENIKSALLALATGAGFIFIFMAFWYRTLGLIANLTLLSNLSLLVMLLSLIQATLTLPGLAGIVLTIGMAVDANVLIFERVREELAAGSAAWPALSRGFDKAYSTIFDSNMTTFMIGAVLFILGSGAIKGFAVTLTLGLLTSMITALIGTQVFIYLFFYKKTYPQINFFIQPSLGGQS